MEEAVVPLGHVQDIEPLTHEIVGFGPLGDGRVLPVVNRPGLSFCIARACRFAGVHRKVHKEKAARMQQRVTASADVARPLFCGHVLKDVRGDNVANAPSFPFHEVWW